MELQPGGAALRLIEEAHSHFKGQFAFATAAMGTDPADMLLDFFGLKRSQDIQVNDSSLIILLVTHNFWAIIEVGHIACLSQVFDHFNISPLHFPDDVNLITFWLNHLI